MHWPIGDRCSAPHHPTATVSGLQNPTPPLPSDTLSPAYVALFFTMSQVEILPPFRYRQPRMGYVEDVEEYVPGGYHPVDIGDVIGSGDQQRYEVIHKLGYGGFSTVWLVRLRGDRPSYFALKILRVDVDDADELKVLQHLRTAAGPHPHVVTLYDSFKVSGPNGEHHCLVFPVLGPSLRNGKVVEALPGPARHQVCCQVASAMVFLHGHGICHGGKLLILHSYFRLSWVD